MGKRVYTIIILLLLHNTYVSAQYEQDKNEYMPTYSIQDRTLQVAKITGATYSDIETVFTAAELEWINTGTYTDAELRNKLNDLRTELPTAFVTT